MVPWSPRDHYEERGRFGGREEDEIEAENPGKKRRISHPPSYEVQVLGLRDRSLLLCSCMPSERHAACLHASF